MTPFSHKCQTCGVDVLTDGRHDWTNYHSTPRHNHSHPEIAWSRGCPACPEVFIAHAWTPVPPHPEEKRA